MKYVCGYDPKVNIRLQDQATTFVQLFHCDTYYPAGSTILEAGCSVGAQTISLALNSPESFLLCGQLEHQELPANLFQAERIIHNLNSILKLCIPIFKD
jgi:hypothetical protein